MNSVDGVWIWASFKLIYIYIFIVFISTDYDDFEKDNLFLFSVIMCLMDISGFKTFV